MNINQSSEDPISDKTLGEEDHGLGQNDGSAKGANMGKEIDKTDLTKHILAVLSDINPELLKSTGKASEKKGTENCSRVNNPDNASGDHGGTQRPGSEKSGELHSSPGPSRMTSPPSVLTGRKNKAPPSGAGLAFDSDENDQEEDPQV